jgi:hypothetical protein
LYLRSTLALIFLTAFSGTPNSVRP